MIFICGQPCGAKKRLAPKTLFNLQTAETASTGEQATAPQACQVYSTIILWPISTLNQEPRACIYGRPRSCICSAPLACTAVPRTTPPNILSTVCACREPLNYTFRSDVEVEHPVSRSVRSLPFVFLLLPLFVYR